MTLPAAPNFRAPRFLRQHIGRIMDFYAGRAIDPSGGMYHFYLDDGTVFDAHTRHLVNATRFVITHAMHYRITGERAAYAGMRHALAFLRQHRDDAPVLLLEGLLRDGRMDEAATLVKTLLADGYKRGDVLDWMQGWRQAKALPGDAVALRNRNALLARADVIAALEPVGRIAPVALYTTGD